MILLRTWGACNFTAAQRVENPSFPRQINTVREGVERMNCYANIENISSIVYPVK